MHYNLVFQGTSAFSPIKLDKSSEINPGVLKFNMVVLRYNNTK